MIESHIGKTGTLAEDQIAEGMRMLRAMDFYGRCGYSQEQYRVLVEQLASALQYPEAEVQRRLDLRCTCPTTLWTGADMNDSTCELSEEEHAEVQRRLGVEDKVSKGLVIPEDLREMYYFAIAWRHEFGGERRYGAGTVEMLIERIAKAECAQHPQGVNDAMYEAALTEIANSPHQAYDGNAPYISEHNSGYCLGVADGHRCAAKTARAALAKADVQR